MDTLDYSLHGRSRNQALMCGHAVDVVLGDVRIVSDYPDENGEVVIAQRDSLFPRGAGTRLVSIKDLTLLPQELTTVEDYTQAPEDTVVYAPDNGAFIKGHGDMWHGTYGSAPCTAEKMAGTQREVLRWDTSRG